MEYGYNWTIERSVGVLKAKSNNWVTRSSSPHGMLLHPRFTRSSPILGWEHGPPEIRVKWTQNWAMDSHGHRRITYPSCYIEYAWHSVLTRGHKSSANLTFLDYTPGIPRILQSSAGTCSSENGDLTTNQVRGLCSLGQVPQLENPWCSGRWVFQCLFEYVLSSEFA